MRANVNVNNVALWKLPEGLSQGGLSGTGSNACGVIAIIFGHKVCSQRNIAPNIDLVEGSLLHKYYIDLSLESMREGIDMYTGSRDLSLQEAVNICHHSYLTIPFFS